MNQNQSTMTTLGVLDGEVIPDVELVGGENMVTTEVAEFLLFCESVGEDKGRRGGE